jgi:hypothetical protein
MGGENAINKLRGSFNSEGKAVKIDNIDPHSYYRHFSPQQLIPMRRI